MMGFISCIIVDDVNIGIPREGHNQGTQPSQGTDVC